MLLERVLAHRTSRQREALIWNAYPGALGSLASYGDSRAHLPIATPILSPPLGPPATPAPLPAPAIPLDSPPTTPGNTFTALLYVQATSPALHKLLANIAGCEFCEKVKTISSEIFTPNHPRLTNSQIKCRWFWYGTASVRLPP